MELYKIRNMSKSPICVAQDVEIIDISDNKNYLLAKPISEF
jgi:hypothetical protein